MAGYDAYRSRFLADAVATAGPAKLLTMLYDRLVLDLDRGEAALREGRRPEGTQQLAHAQQIVAELIADLDVDAWEGGEGLLALYTFALSELIEAGLTGDADRAAGVRGVIAPLRDTWHEAAASLAADVPTQRDGALGASTGVLGVG
ncbi:flagellar export chaperone FliS [Cellulomonas sp. RIT-PI-Y]|jgi:flagellar secretion chaperone FliS|uniref:flagellar export chaperone FliS n=1 Tax=Cellulomonas sp. RIT-PI-Y TaxID=3035297 RepID=UPI0021D8ECC0|nr:flagellar export chaperone FliS [Cellulomonas sp. RIT-PI-Y]